MKAIALLALALPFGALAQGFTDPGPTCYTWEGGHKSAGSFSKCNPELMPAKKLPLPVVAATQAVVPPTQVIFESSCPPPEPKVQPLKKKKKRKVVKC